jgi:hypothetical protein
LAEFEAGGLLSRLATDGVDFVLVGGLAVVLQAQPRFTNDADICYSIDPANLQTLGEALVGLDARLRGIDEDPPFFADARILRQTSILCLTTSLGDLDLLVDPPGCPPYDELRADAEVQQLDGFTLRVASIPHLLAMKRAAGRPQDQWDVDALEVARRRRGLRRRRG